MLANVRKREAEKCGKTAQKTTKCIEAAAEMGRQLASDQPI